MHRIKTIGVAVSFLLLAQSLSAQIITTVAGTSWTFPSSSLAATSAPLGQISGVAVDRNTGNIYVADSDNNMVMRISGAALTVVAGNGLQGYSGDGGPATAASMNPTDVAVDSQGNLFIVDGSRIRKVDHTTGNVTTFAGNGILGYSGDGGPAASAAIDPYTGIAVDAGGNVYFADTFNNVVRKIAPDGSNIATVVGSYPGTAGFNGDGQPATKALLNNPYGLALDSAGNIYISDSKNHRVRMVTASNGGIGTLFGTASSASSGDGLAAVSASLIFPTGLTVDAAGNLYVSDELANNVRMVAASGSIVSTIAGASGNATPGFAGDTGSAAKALLSSPWGVGVDTSGNVYIADSANSRLRKVAAGTINTMAGNGAFRYAGDNGSAINAQLNSPQGLTFDSNGTMYIADSNNNRIRKVTSTGVISTYYVGSANTSPLSSPTGLALDSLLNLYIADTGNNVVRMVTPGGAISTVAGGGSSFTEGAKATSVSIGAPTGVAVDSGGNIYVAASTDQKVYQITPDHLIHTFAGYGSSVANPGATGATQVGLNDPLDVAVDGAGNVYIADTGNNLIREVTGTTIKTVAGNGKTTETDGALATQSGVFLPQAVSIDSSGNLYIAEEGGRIREVAAKTGIITTIAGEGSPTVIGDGGNAISAGINEPEAVALNQGTLYIADSGNGRVRALIAAQTAAPGQPPPPPPPVQITFAATPLTLAFNGNNANGPTAAQTVNLTASLAGLNYTVTANAPWLSVTPLSGTMPGLIQVTANPSGMAAGVYQGLVTVTSPAAAPSTATVAVTFTVTAATPPALGVDTQNISLTGTQSSSAVSQQIHVQDTGGGTVPFTVTTSAGGGTWLSVSISSGTATPTAPVALNVTANPNNLAVGTYSGSVTVTGAGSSITIAVTLTVSPSTSVILVSQSALTFTAVAQGGSPLPQSFGILNVGQGSMSWTASANTLSGGNWLQISKTSGTVQTPYLDVSLVDVTINPASLASGTYYGQIQVASLATNTPQLLTVILTVLPAGFSLGPQVYPTGLIFTGVAGVTPGSQDVMVSNPAGTSNSYLSGIIGSGFSFAPTNAAIQIQQPSTLHVYPNFSGLNPATIQQGTITLQFADRSPSQTVNVLIVVAPTGVVPSSARPGEANPEVTGLDPRASGCSGQALNIQYRNLQANFAATVGQATSLEVQVADGCGNLINGGQGAQVTTYFSNGNSVAMTPIGGALPGVWQGTWTPGSTGTFVAKVSALAPVSGTVVGGTSAALTCVVNSQAPTPTPTPTTTPQSVVQAASDAAGVPIAPGELITVYGQNLADGTSQSTTLPLPQQVNGTTVMLGNQPLPILYSSSGQMNVQVPYTVPVNTQYQLSVQNGTTLSVPQTLVVAEAVPGIFTVNNQGTGQGDILDGATLAQPGTPATAGDEVVIYCTGLGAVTGSVTAGMAAPSNPLAYTVNTATVTIGGVPAQVAFSGLTPGFPGLYQVNAIVPAGVAAGDAVPVVITVAGQSSTPVTMAVH